MSEQEIQELLKNPKLNDLKELLISLENNQTKPREIINLINKKDNIQNNINEIEQMRNAWLNIQQTLTSLSEAIKNIDENKSKIDELKTFHHEAIIGNIQHKSIKDNIQDLHDELVQLKTNHEKIFNEEQKNINRLLTGATEASLSIGYKEKREENLKEKHKWDKVFIGAVVVFAIAFIIYFIYSFQENFSYIHFIRGFPIFLFSGFFCYYSTKQIDKYSRLEQEYAHKESLSKTYEGYNKQIEDLETNEASSNLKIKLMDIMLKSAELNPSKTLEKADGTKPHEMLGKENNEKK